MVKKQNKGLVINTKKIQSDVLKEIEQETIEEYKQQIKDKVKQKIKEIKMAKIVVSRLEKDLDEMTSKSYTEEELLFGDY